METNPQPPTEAPVTSPTTSRGRKRRRRGDTAEAATAEPTPREQELSAENDELRHALRRTDCALGEMREMVDQLTVEPWPIARLVRVLETPRGARALVHAEGARRVIGIHPDCDRDGLACGDFVQLASERNLVMATLGLSMPMGGEIARFERFAPDGRLVVRSREEELLVDAGERLDLPALEPGDPIRWDRGAELALERFEPEEGESFLLEDPGDHDRTAIGGLGPVFQRLYEGLALPLLAPEDAARLGLVEPPVALLHGPPGCGKTLIARTLASVIRRETGRPCRLAVVRPGEFKSPYVGETEARIRACFAALRRAARDELVVLFLDEIDAIGRIRGGAASQHADSALGALLAEIGGFEQRGNVAIIAATNRRDVIDAALLSRFQDMDLAVGRPKRSAAEAIFRIHLPETVPFADDGGRDPRSAAIAAAVALLYAPNAGSELCRIRLRDATTRDVHARELVSGRLIAQIVRMAKRSALSRRHRGQQLGLTAGDLTAAVAEVVGELAHTLTPTNARAQLDDLPQDVDVVRVDPLRPRVARLAEVAHAG